MGLAQRSNGSKWLGRPLDTRVFEAGLPLQFDIGSSDNSGRNGGGTSFCPAASALTCGVRGRWANWVTALRFAVDRQSELHHVDRAERLDREVFAKELLPCHANTPVYILSTVRDDWSQQG